MGDIRLFISHAHKNRDIASDLVRAIEATSFKSGERILCTSVEGYGYPKDVDVIDHLRTHLKQSSCVVSIWTPDTRQSEWCMFELGGAWTLASSTYVLLVGQREPPRPLSRAFVTNIGTTDEVNRFLRNLRRRLNWDERGGGLKEVENLVETARKHSETTEAHTNY